MSLPGSPAASRGSPARRFAGLARPPLRDARSPAASRRPPLRDARSRAASRRSLARRFAGLARRFAGLAHSSLDHGYYGLADVLRRQPRGKYGFK
eukprot:1328531-Pleurochrysis_carterae.AAC.1